MFYLTRHSTHFIYVYMASDIWLRTILIVRKETHCRHIGYSFRLTAMVILYAPSHRQDSTYHGLCYTSRGALAGMRNPSFNDWKKEMFYLRTHSTHLIYCRDSLLLLGESSLVSSDSRSSLLLSKWFLSMYLMTFNNKSNRFSVLLNKTFSFFLLHCNLRTLFELTFTQVES